MTTKGITSHKPVTEKTGKVRLKPTAPKGQSVSAKIAQRNSKKQTAVPPGKSTARGR